MSSSVPFASVPSPPSSAERLRRLLAIGAATAGKVGESFFRSLVEHVAEALEADVAFVAELAQPGIGRVLASFAPDPSILPEGSEFLVEGSPCEVAYANEIASFPEGTVARFPGDPFVAKYGLDGYLGILLQGADGEPVGHLGVMATRRIEADADEVAALRIFAARAAAEIERRRHETALAAREAELRSSRARIVEASDEERRRLGRDLHDGAQQRLVALGHFLDMARRKLTDDPETAARLLEEAREQTSAASRELRELAHGLHPTMLAERGLRATLTSVAARSPVPLVLDALPERRLADQVESTVYFLVCEALTNAAKHADASAVHVRVGHRAATLVAEVSDDGRGGARSDTGSGLAGLAARVEALGGSFRVDSPPGAGTRIEARIPAAPRRTPREPFLELGYEGDGGHGERLIAQILSGEKTVSISLAREWDLEGGPPRVGQRLPIMDQHGRRRGEVDVVRVASLPFGAISEDVVQAESAGAKSLEQWRASQRRVYDEVRDETALLLDEPGWRLTDEEAMVILWFRRVGAASDR